MAHVVWLKRDLRIVDHAPLAEAARRGPVVVLFVYEGVVLRAPEHDASHFTFVDESLAELDAALATYGGGVTYRIGEMPAVLAALADEVAIDGLWSHEETGTLATFARDRAVGAWCRQRGIAWTQLPQFGVFRAQRTRDDWSKRWERRMREPALDAPERITFEPVARGERATLASLGLPPSEKTGAQHGGTKLARETLASFLCERGAGYRKGMSSPVTGERECSRLSAHIAYGTISLRTIVHAARMRAAEVEAALAVGERIDERWHGALQSFEARLHWHDHFIQKLEDQPSLENENQSRSYDGLRENDFDEARFAAWCQGRTGFPMVDACMRALHHTGWINFRMRAMLMSFASYDLWLDWRPTSRFLARAFLDFEPGIHYPQSQMQAGVTGINAIRIYSPAKQVVDHDPYGVFVRRYVPELANVPDEYLADPHLVPPLLAGEFGFRPGVDYPLPIVDRRDAVAFAKKRIAVVRRSDGAREEARDVLERHGSRKPALRR